MERKKEKKRGRRSRHGFDADAVSPCSGVKGGDQCSIFAVLIVINYECKLNILHSWSGEEQRSSRFDAGGNGETLRAHPPLGAAARTRISTSGPVQFAFL